jgi:HSP20 family protein
MTTFLWQIAPELEQLRRQMDELFDGGPTPERKATAPAWQPRAEVWELDDAYQIQLQVPGVDPNQIEIEASRDRIKVKGDRKAPETQTKALHSEFRYGHFERSFHLSQEVQHQQVTAAYNQGILTLTLPKLTAAPDHTVKVQVASPIDGMGSSVGHTVGDRAKTSAQTTEPVMTPDEDLKPVW